MKRALTLLFALLCVCMAVPGAGATDAVTSASVTYFYGQSAITKEELLEQLELGAQKNGAVTVATVSADGSPNLAVVIPGVADENTLVFALAPNQTRVNFAERKVAVMAYYIYNPDAAEKPDRNRGCRVHLKLVEDETRLTELNEGKEKPENYQYFEIVKIEPLG